MFKTYFTLVIFTFSIEAGFSQKLEYGNFLQTDTAVKWAAVYNSILDLTPVNPNMDINKFYLGKLKSQEVNVYKEDSSLFAVERSGKRYEDYVKAIQPVLYDELKMNWSYDFSDASDVSEAIFKNEHKCDSCYLSNERSFSEVKQLFFYKDHQLFVRNILLKPVFYAKKELESKEESRFYTGDAVAFDNAEKTMTIPPSAKFIARTSNQLNFAIYLKNNERRPLNTHRYTLFREIFWDVKKGLLKAFSTDQSIIPPYKYLKKDTVENYQSPLIEVPVYDENGNLTVTKLMRNEMNLDSFYMFALMQDIYFDFTNEKLYSKVVSLIPMHRVVTSVGIDLGYWYYWGVHFPAMLTKKPRKK